MYRVSYDAGNGHGMADQPHFTATLQNAQQLPPDEVPFQTTEPLEAA